VIRGVLSKGASVTYRPILANNGEGSLAREPNSSRGNLGVVIEWLEFQVPAADRERYVRIDDDIWTLALQRYPGFIGKETWIDPQDLERVVLVIHWQSRDAWKAIPEADLAEIEQRFDQTFATPYQLVTSREFQIRRFPVESPMAG
jgi:uncharacterized protein (TIGR03792 family)